MKSKFLTQLFTDTPMTLVGLIIFFVLFNGLLAWVYLRKGAKKEYDDLAQMPLIEERYSYDRR